MRRVNNHSSHRSAFTLVELLVAIIIFLILASLSIGAFSAATDGEKGPAAAASFRAWIEGAKSRAAKLGRPVGLRPVIVNDGPHAFGHAANEFEYVASPEPLTGALNDTSTAIPGSLPSGFVEADGLRYVLSERKWQVVQDPGAVPAWSDLDGLDSTGATVSAAVEQQLIVPGNRIGITINGGETNWFVISSDSFNPSATGAMNRFFIEGHVPDAIWLNNTTPANGEYVVSQIPGTTTFSIQYEIELATDFLEGERPLRLPADMMVDLDASTVPSYPTDGGDADTSAFNDPFPANALVFSPTGEVLGGYQSLSALTFYLAPRDEVLGARADPLHPANSTTNGSMPTTYSDWVSSSPRPFPIRAEPIGDPQIVTVYPKTGFVQKSLINFDDSDGDGFANSPFSFRFEGRFDK